MSIEGPVRQKAMILHLFFAWTDCISYAETSGLILLFLEYPQL